MRNFWHTNRLNWRSCATPPLFPQKNEKILAHKLPKLKIVCHSSPIPTKKREIFGTQIAQIRNRVPLLTNLRRKMSNKRDRRRKGVIYPGQYGTGRSQNTFFTETGKEPVAISILLPCPFRQYKLTEAGGNLRMHAKIGSIDTENRKKDRN